MRSSQNRQRQARNVNDVIDRALQQPTDTHVREVARLLTTGETPGETYRLAERVRRRGVLLARRERPNRAAIVRARDRLILAIYAHASPAGWYTAWCDGSVTADGRHAEAGIGGLVMDPAGRIMAQLARRIPRLAPFEAEIAALAAAMQLAHAQGAQRLRVYSDCDALVRLWQWQRDDPRLEPVSTLAKKFRRLEVCALPRLHNQPAHRLARTGTKPEGTDKGDPLPDRAERVDRDAAGRKR